MPIRFYFAALAVLAWFASARAASYEDIDAPPHLYWQRPLKDRFTLLKPALESGQVPLDTSGELPYLRSLLQRLGVPASSQMLVFSTTSLQLSLISPRNPRALYFNEDIYLGFIPGGRIELISLDPEIGGIFYIFDIPRGAAPLQIERSTRCMNCHAGSDTREVPGIVVKSVIPGPRGGSLTAYRIEETGHQIPFHERFGGWYVTAQGGLTNHHGNQTGQLNAGQLTRFPIEPGTLFDFARYPVATSDLLPQLLHEHQAGFVNRVLEASYRARTHLYADKGKLTPEHAAELDQQADTVVRYLLFTDEPALPSGGVPGATAFKTDFLRTRRAVQGKSLKDFNLQNRLFEHRCSYMIYSAVFTGLPPEMKQRIYARLKRALTETDDPLAKHLPAAEKAAIQTILRGTLKDLPRGW
jgi:hypothetical protein